MIVIRLVLGFAIIYAAVWLESKAALAFLLAASMLAHEGTSILLKRLRLWVEGQTNPGAR